MAENSEIKKRTLTDNETERIKKLNLSPKQEETVRDVWVREEDSHIVLFKVIR